MLYLCRDGKRPRDRRNIDHAYRRNKMPQHAKTPSAERGQGFLNFLMVWFEMMQHDVFARASLSRCRLFGLGMREPLTIAHAWA